MPSAPAHARPAERAYVEDAIRAIPLPARATAAGPAPALASVIPALRPPTTFSLDTLALLDTEMKDFSPLLPLQPLASTSRLVLIDANSANVTAKLLVYDPSGRVTEDRTFPDPLHPAEPPPYTLLPSHQLPSPDDTARLFSLSPDQREPFLLYATLLLAEKAGRRPAPLTSILTGKPGTGKSQVILALLWFAYQHRCSHMIAIVSYTWRAALHVSPPPPPLPVTRPAHAPPLRHARRTPPPATSARARPPSSPRRTTSTLTTASVSSAT